MKELMTTEEITALVKANLFYFDKQFAIPNFEYCRGDAPWYVNWTGNLWEKMTEKNRLHYKAELDTLESVDAIDDQAKIIEDEDL